MNEQTEAPENGLLEEKISEPDETTSENDLSDIADFIGVAPTIQLGERKTIATYPGTVVEQPRIL